MLESPTRNYWDKTEAKHQFTGAYGKFHLEEPEELLGKRPYDIETFRW